MLELRAVVEDTTRLCEGAVVKLSGLHDASQQNGQLGVLQQFNEKICQWNVDIDEFGAQAIKVQNCKCEQVPTPILAASAGVERAELGVQSVAEEMPILEAQLKVKALSVPAVDTLVVEEGLPVMRTASAVGSELAPLIVPLADTMPANVIKEEYATKALSMIESLEVTSLLAKLSDDQLEATMHLAFEGRPLRQRLHIAKALQSAVDDAVVALTVHSVDGEVCDRLPVPAALSAAELKVEISQLTGVRPQDERLFCRGHELDDTECPLLDATVNGDVNLFLDQKACTVHEKDGSVFNGFMRYGKYHGFGTMKYPDGCLYIGDWRDGIPHGRGRQESADGSTYEGTFRAGLRDGTGRLVSLSGIEYEGVFQKDRPHGVGRLMHADGEVCSGYVQHLNGQLQGKDGALGLSNVKFDDGAQQPTWERAKKDVVPASPQSTASVVPVLGSGTSSTPSGSARSSSIVSQRVEGCEFAGDLSNGQSEVKHIALGLSNANGKLDGQQHPLLSDIGKDLESSSTPSVPQPGAARWSPRMLSTISCTSSTPQRSAGKALAGWTPLASACRTPSLSPRMAPPLLGTSPLVQKQK